MINLKSNNEKMGERLTGGLAQAGAYLVGQLAVFRKFSSRPSVSGNPRLPQAASTLCASVGRQLAVQENFPTTCDNEAARPAKLLEQEKFNKIWYSTVI